MIQTKGYFGGFLICVEQFVRKEKGWPEILSLLRESFWKMVDEMKDEFIGVISSIGF